MKLSKNRQQTSQPSFRKTSVLPSLGQGKSTQPQLMTTLKKTIRQMLEGSFGCALHGLSIQYANLESLTPGTCATNFLPQLPGPLTGERKNQSRRGLSSSCSISSTPAAHPKAQRPHHPTSSETVVLTQEQGNYWSQGWTGPQSPPDKGSIPFHF